MFMMLLIGISRPPTLFSEPPTSWTMMETNATLQFSFDRQWRKFEMLSIKEKLSIQYCACTSNFASSNACFTCSASISAPERIWGLHRTKASYPDMTPTKCFIVLNKSYFLNTFCIWILTNGDRWMGEFRTKMLISLSWWQEGERTAKFKLNLLSKNMISLL